MCDILARMEPFERVARAAVEEAGTLLRATWREAKRVEFKSAVDLVTDTDRAIEALVVARLRAAFPDDLIVAEEAHGDAPMPAPRAGERVWYLDPLDGTTNFAHAYPQFAVSLALADGDALRFGIVHDPVREETFVAEHGGGATLNGTPIHVSPVGELAEALVATGFPYDRRVHADFYLAFFRDFIRTTQGVRRAGAAALDLCWVACGRLDGFWEWKLHPWDVAAGTLIVREAQGAVSDFRGRPFDLFGDQTLASNGLVHAAMSRLLAVRLAEQEAP
jgi:myo-inositol-1(or 4)-monophosphatase